MINRENRNKILPEVKPVENIRASRIPCKRKTFFHIDCKTMHMSNRILFE